MFILIWRSFYSTVKYIIVTEEKLLSITACTICSCKGIDSVWYCLQTVLFPSCRLEGFSIDKFLTKLKHIPVSKNLCRHSSFVVTSKPLSNLTWYLYKSKSDFYVKEQTRNLQGFLLNNTNRISVPHLFLISNQSLSQSWWQVDFFGNCYYLSSLSSFHFVVVIVSKLILKKKRWYDTLLKIYDSLWTTFITYTNILLHSIVQ